MNENELIDELGSSTASMVLLLLLRIYFLSVPLQGLRNR